MNRRHLMAALLGGLLVRPRVAAAKPTSGRVRPDPDFSLLARDPHLVGVRPFRKGGVRLEIDAPLGGSTVIHNYGHAGGGITLSFGCAEEVADLTKHAVTLHDEPSVAVVGTGVIGLTSALAIRRRLPGVPIRIYARDLRLESTTSSVAGGQFEPSGVWRQQRDAHGRARLESWLRRARSRILDLRDEWHRYGIAERDNFTLGRGDGAFDHGVPRDVVPEAVALAALPFESLVAPGQLYKTWLLDPMRLLPALKTELEQRQVSFEARTFESARDLAALEQSIIVNCTGFGAAALLGDRDLLAQRGHLVRLRRPSEAHDYFFGGGCENRVNCYVFCRHDDIVVGGTVVAGDARDTVLEEDGPVFARLLRNGRRVFGGAPDSCER